MDTHRFNEQYVMPRLQKLMFELESLDYDQKVLWLLRYCRVNVSYDGDGEVGSMRISVSDAISMLDHLSAVEFWWNDPLSIQLEILDLVASMKTLCKRTHDRWEVSVYMIEEVELLKKLGIYEQTLNIIVEVEKLYNRFSSGDFGFIEPVMHKKT